MTETVERTRYTSPSGIDRESLPWRLWEKSKKLFWDPADLDFTKDKADWDSMSEEVRAMMILGARGFMVGEEAVTLDIVPLLRAISDEGRLEETIFLTSFTLEEAKHVDFFRSWFDAVGADPSSLPMGGYAQQSSGATSERSGDANGYQGDIFAGELERVMTRLDSDRSPEAFLDAGITYNQFIEGVAAIAGYKGWAKFLEANGNPFPGFQEGLALVQRDERRHIAYGTYLCRRIIAAHPEVWPFVERRWEELTKPYLENRIAGRGRYVKALIDRRLEVMRGALNLSVEAVEGGSLDELEATNDLVA
jgi:ribonucleoside-diphosphate reductase beta chain